MFTCPSFRRAWSWIPFGTVAFPLEVRAGDEWRVQIERVHNLGCDDEPELTIGHGNDIVVLV